MPFNSTINPYLLYNCSKVHELEEELTVVGANIKTLQVQNDQVRPQGGVI